MKPVAASWSFPPRGVPVRTPMPPGRLLARTCLALAQAQRGGPGAGPVAPAAARAGARPAGDVARHRHPLRAAVRHRRRFLARAPGRLGQLPRLEAPLFRFGFPLPLSLSFSGPPTMSAHPSESTCHPGGDTPAQPQTIVVLGIGNLLWADEGFGVRCIE